MFDSFSIQPAGFGLPIGDVLRMLANDDEPGPTAAAMLTALDPAGLSRSERIDLLVGLERQAAWLAGCSARALAALDAPEPGPPPGPPVPTRPPVGSDEDWIVLEVAAALRLSPVTAEGRLRVARDLQRRLPGTARLLAEGLIPYWHAVAVVEACHPLDDAAAAAVEARVLVHAADQSGGQLRRSLRRAVIAADPRTAAEREHRASADRTVGWWPLPDGMAELRMTGPAAGVATVYTGLTALADRPREHADQRRIDARRFDAMVEVFRTVLDDPTLPARHGQRPHICLTVAASTMLGADDQPGELAGYGPIGADVAREVAADGDWRRILTDPAGRLLDYGRTVYRPPADLSRHITARDQVCTFPSCNQPAMRCDIDHARPWHQGGCTDPDNCGTLCRRHHRAKTIAGWQLRRPDEHTSVWTSPAGKTYTTHPPPYGPDP